MHALPACITCCGTALSLQLRNVRMRTRLDGVLAAAASLARAGGVVLLGHGACALPASARVCQPRLRQPPCKRCACCTCAACMLCITD